MKTKVLSSDKARANWRDVLDAAAAGDGVVIERYGKPTAVIVSYCDFVEWQEQRKGRVPSRSSELWEQMKAELLAELKAEIMTGDGEKRSWLEDLRALQQQIAESGGLSIGTDPETIVEKMRQTRQEIFEAEYAHLYR